jgi:beta-glucosidase-like glycosyl hydrolase
MIDLGVPRLDIAPYIWWSEALHGAIAPFQHHGAKPATVWPEPITVGASMNASLFRALGELTSTEARGLQAGAGNTYWAPNVNIFRDPRWGRGQETPGEDPTLSSSYAASFVGGMQGSSSSSSSSSTPFLKVAATLKHLAAYSQETGRINDPIVVEARDMEDTYLPAFEAGVRLGKAAGIMCSYNAETFGYASYGNASTPPGQYGGVPSCANEGVLTTLARDTWGFEGYVTTDCGAADYVGGFMRNAGIPADAADVVRAVLGAGVDTDCGGGTTPNWSNDTLLRLLTNASTSPSITPLVDAALGRLFTVRMRLGQFDDASLQPWGGYGLEVVDTPAHRALATDAALQGFVLLKHEHATLPLKRSARLAVLGPNTQSGSWALGNYHERKAPPGLVLSPCHGLAAAADASVGGQVTCSTPPGCSIGGNATCFDAASRSAVEAADAVVLFVGLDGTQEAEGRDKTSLRLPGTQQAMVASAIAAATSADADPKPVVVVVMGGSAVDLSTIAASPAVHAIVWVGYPGQAAGAAIASALHGANRWGKLPITFYDQGFCAAANLSDYRMRPDATTGYPGRTHRFYTGAPVFKFGAGLSYTTFERELAWAAGSAGGTSTGTGIPTFRVSSGGGEQRDYGDADRVVASVEATVTNTGAARGDEVIMLFVSPPPAATVLGAPRQQLAAFARVSLGMRGVTTVVLEITQRHLATTVPIAARGAAGSGGVWSVRTNDDNAVLRFAVRYE